MLFDAPIRLFKYTMHGIALAFIGFFGWLGYCLYHLCATPTDPWEI